MLNGVLDIENEMNDVAKESCKALLYTKYYHLEMKNDGEKGLNEKEYDRLINSLTNDQRKRFLRLGSFDQLAGDDGIIDLKEFGLLIERFLDYVHVEHFKIICE